MFVEPWLFVFLTLSLMGSIIGWLVCWVRMGDVQYIKSNGETWREYCKKDIAEVHSALHALKKYEEDWQTDSSDGWQDLNKRIEDEITAARLEREIIRLHEKELTQLRGLKEQVKALVVTDEDE